jgi:hypothetical protein
MQERFAELKRARMTLEKRGTLKLVCAKDMRRGMESPSVTLETPERVVVVQPVEPPMVQVGPVKPLMHRHEQPPSDVTIEVPPFRHSVALLDSHMESAVVEPVPMAAEVFLGL